MVRAPQDSVVRGDAERAVPEELGVVEFSGALFGPRDLAPEFRRLCLQDVAVFTCVVISTVPAPADQGALEIVEGSVFAERQHESVVEGGELLDGVDGDYLL
mgnify:CR=1 FL=1